jgi:hypothetical protein
MNGRFVKEGMRHGIALFCMYDWFWLLQVIKQDFSQQYFCPIQHRISGDLGTPVG